MGEDVLVIWSILLGIPAFCGALLLVFAGAGFLRARLDRYEERPHALARQTEEEFAALRLRLDELEGQGAEVRQLTERVSFLERLLENPEK